MDVALQADFAFRLALMNTARSFTKKEGLKILGSIERQIIEAYTDENTDPIRYRCAEFKKIFSKLSDRIGPES